MLRAVRLKFLFLFCLTVLAVFLVLPSWVQMPSWWETYISRGLNLGLDLKGGMHLVLEVDLEQAIKNELDRTARNLNAIADRQKIDVIKRRITETKNLKPEDVIILTDKSHLVSFSHSVFGRSFITALRMPEGYIASFDKKTYYYPYLEAVFFALIRVIAYESEKSYAQYKELIWKWYRQIPNIERIDKDRLVRMCLEDDGFGEPARLLILQLIIPDASELSTEEDIRQLYERERELLLRA